jgi:hypothetical protein
LDVVFFPCFAHDIASIKQHDLNFKLPSSIDSIVLNNYLDGTLLREQSELLKMIVENKKELIIINNMSFVSVDQSVNIPMWLMNTLLECDNIISNNNKNTESPNQLLTILITRTGFVPSGFYMILNKLDAIKTLYLNFNDGSITSIVNNERAFSKCTSGSINSINDIHSDDILLYFIDEHGMSISLDNNSNKTLEVADILDKTIANNLNNETSLNSTDLPFFSGGSIFDNFNELKRVELELPLNNIVINKSLPSRKLKKLNLFNTSKFI